MKPFMTNRPPRPGAAARCAVALVLGACMCIAKADPITFSFDASLTQDPFGLSRFGAPVSGRYTFDTLAADGVADPSSGAYASTGDAFGFDAVVDGVAYQARGRLDIGTQVGQPGLYLVSAQAGPLLLELVLQDIAGGAVTRDALPLLAPDLSAFAVHEFRLFADDAEFSATLSRLQAVTPGVPEPGPASLLLGGLLAVALRAAGRRRIPLMSNR